MAPAPQRIRVACLSLSAVALLTACHPSMPGWGPLQVAPETIDPEPSCGHWPDPVLQARWDDKGEPILNRRDATGRILGAADFHNHQFSNVGFGGRIVWGSAFAEGGIEEAVSNCGSNDLCLDEKEFALCTNLACLAASDKEACRAGCESRKCQSLKPHGHFGDTDPVGPAIGQGVGHRVNGYPMFEGWPHFSTYTHQQEYHRWLRRAFDGGLKLIVVHAVTNEILCEALGHEHPCDDMTNARLELEEARRLEKYIDFQDDCDDRNGSGWYRIAYSPEEARQIIADGAMAVVLGMEVDSVFDCKKSGGCTPESLPAKIKEFRDLGVRHVFPIHLFDNAFGGTAAFNDVFNAGGVILNHGLLDVGDCSSPETGGYQFQFGGAESEATDLLHLLAAKLGADYGSYKGMGAHCNNARLSPLGSAVIADLMDQKMIIDVDHMSTLSRCDAFDIAEKHDPPYEGFVSGHSGFTEILTGRKKNEGQLRPKEVERLVKLGGLLAPILSQGDLNETKPYKSRDGTSIPNDCGDSSKTFAQAYLYAVDAMGRRGVGFGSDMNGLAGLPRPRFGDYACKGDIGAPQQQKIDYPVPVYRSMHPRLLRAKAGNRVFDYNVDGFAHIGMFPDFVADLSADGLTESELEPLFRGAEAYIEMWECTENPGRPGCHGPQEPYSMPDPVCTAKRPRR